MKRTRAEVARENFSTHGLSHLPEHVVWSAMRQRCNDPRHMFFKNYGGRGIKVCARWNNFEHFIADMGERPTAKHTLERIDNDGHYSPENCKWVTRKEQCRNKRTNVFLTHDGLTKTVAEWAEIMGILDKTIYNRKKLGWSDCDAITRKPSLARFQPRIPNHLIKWPKNVKKYAK